MRACHARAAKALDVRVEAAVRRAHLADTATTVRPGLVQHSRNRWPVSMSTPSACGRMAGSQRAGA